VLPSRPPVNVRASLDTAVVTCDVGALLAHARRASGVAAKRHARDLLERALLGADPGAVSDAQRRQAAKLGVSAGDAQLQMPPHAVLVPLVVEGQVGLVRAMRVAFDASAQGGYALGFDDVAARSVSEALDLAGAHLGRHANGQGYTFTSVHPDAFAQRGNDGWHVGVQSRARIGGASLGAAALVSAVALWSERTVKRGTVVTGRLLGTDIGDVGDVDAKLQAALSTRSDVTQVLVPHAALSRARRNLSTRSKVALIGVRDVQQLLDAALEPKAAKLAPLRHRVMTLRTQFERGWSNFGWANVCEQAERLLSATPERSMELRVELWSMLSAAHERLGSPTLAMAIQQQALETVGTDSGGRWVPDFALCRLYQTASATQRVLGHAENARQAARRAVTIAARGRMRDELYKSHGCVGLVELSVGRAAAAAKAFDAALELVHEHAPESCARTHGYLVEALSAAGDHDRAREQYELALAHLNVHDAGGQRATHEAWLRTGRAAGLLRLGSFEQVTDVLSAPCVTTAIDRTPSPGLRARRYLGTAWIALGEIDKGQALLAASTVAHGTDLGPNLRFAAHLNVVCEASSLLSRGHWDQDIDGRLRVALDHVPEYLRAGMIGRARDRVLKRLAGVHRSEAERAQLQEALGALIQLCERIT